jgi:flagellar motor protein MotB
MGRRVQRLSGSGFDSLIKWDGRDKKGMIVKEGSYNATLTVWGRGMKAVSPTRVITVDNTPPVAHVSVSTPVLDKMDASSNTLTFLLGADDKSPIDRWQLQLMDLRGKTVTVWTSTGAPSNLIWDGRDPSSGITVPRGKYRCAFQVWDQADNVSDPSFVDVEVNITAREALQQELKLITVHETSMGLIVQLGCRDLFVVEDEKMVLARSAIPLLHEVALLINAYPDAPVRLDGYSKSKKTFVQDKNLSSLYSWSAYSYLVKEERMKASRLTVRGLGRSPLFERRALNGPEWGLLRDGVEIILEGSGAW